MDFIDENVLESSGFGNTSPEDYFRNKCLLRDGRDAAVWVNKNTGHGILDVQFWQGPDYYNENYRKEFGARIEGKTSPSEHLMIFDDLNERQFQTFSSNLTKETKFLEIGSSFGGILNKVAGAGVEICHGVEPNKQDADFVLKYNKKMKIFNSTFEKAELPVEYYDMIVGIEVFEHAVSPRLFLEKCFDLLCENGHIHVEVPNHDDVLLKAYNNPGYHKFYYHKAHIHYFTKKSLCLLFRECGFNGSAASFLMYPFFNHVWWHQNRKPQLSALTALSTPVPTDGNSPAQKAINGFFKKVEMDYDALINTYVLGDCLIYQGQKI